MTCSPPRQIAEPIHLLCRRRVGQLAEQHRCRKPQLQVRSLSEFLDRADGWRPIYQFELWVGRRPAWPSRRQSRQGTRWRPFRHLDPPKQWRSHDNDADRSRLQRRCGPRRLRSSGAFQGNNLLVQADQGLMRGQGILALNFDFGYGMSSFVQGDVYGGAHLFGAGGRAGLRYQW